MNDRSLDDLHPDLKPLCEAWLARCRRQSIPVRVIETYRSAADQAKAYAVGRDESGHVVGKILTAAKPGQSPHNFTLGGRPASKAFDWCVMKPDGSCDWNAKSTEWQTAVAIAKSLGLKWGGDFSFRDNDHFQIT